MKNSFIPKITNADQQKYTINIDHYHWSQDYTPETNAVITYSDAALKLKFESYDFPIVAVNKIMNSPVCQDNCVEFFFNPNPDKDTRYMNFEINPIGTLYLGLGKDRYDSKPLKEDQTIFNIKTSITEQNIDTYDKKSWTVEYEIPFSFIEKYYGKLNFGSGMVIRANFYKCGDKAPRPHYGSWSAVLTEGPDFHQPEFFGELKFI